MTTKIRRPPALLSARALAAAGLFASATAAAQGLPATPPVFPAPAPTSPRPGAGTEPPAPALADGPGPSTPAMPPAGALARPGAAAGESTSLPDLTGAVGFGLSLIPNPTLIGTSGGVGIKAWLSDKLALSPLVNLRYSKVSGTTAWSVRLEAAWLFVLFKRRSTRLEAGGGLSATLSQTPTNLAPGDMGPGTDTRYSVSVPLQAGVEHFLARWLSLGLAARAPLIEVASDGEGNSVSFALDSTVLLAQIFFYSD